jgi:hypothetical protein
LVSSKQYERAISELKPLASSSDPRVALDAVRSILYCLEQSSGDVEGFCRDVVSSGGTGSLARMVAGAKLGECLAEKAKRESDAARACAMYREAIQTLVTTVVVYFPGRGGGLDEEHQNALLELGHAYEGLAEKVEGSEAKRTYFSMAVRTYREVFSAYPNSDAAQPAAQRAGELESKTQEGSGSP